MKRLALLVATLLLGGAGTAHAAWYFEIDATIQRPSYQYPDGDSCWARSGSDCSVTWVPASFQVVLAWQPGPFGPQYCGGGVTDAEGHLSGVGFTCGDNPPAWVQLEALGDSGRGFRVGFNGPLAYEYLHVAYAYQWYSQWVGTQNQWRAGTWSNATLGFGGFRVGGAMTGEEFRAALVYELVDTLYREWDISNSWSMWSAWIINDVVNTEANPWVYWMTVHIPSKVADNTALSQVPQQLARVIYNGLHSSETHYDVDRSVVFGGFSGCQAAPYYDANYDGYADAFRNLTWARQAGTSPTPGCPGLGLNLGGNAEAFYTYAIAGSPVVRPRASIAQWTKARIGANEYAFPPSLSLVSLVSTAGTRAESVSGMWVNALRAVCTGNQLGVPVYCADRRFRCLVQEKHLAASNELTPDFLNLDCGPGISSTTGTTRPSTSDQLSVWFTPADVVDTYQLVVTRANNSTNTFPVNVSNQDVTKTMKVVVKIPRCEQVSVLIKTTHGSISRQGPVRMVAKASGCP